MIERDYSVHLKTQVIRQWAFPQVQRTWGTLSRGLFARGDAFLGGFED